MAPAADRVGGRYPGPQSGHPHMRLVPSVHSKNFRGADIGCPRTKSVVSRVAPSRAAAVAPRLCVAPSGAEHRQPINLVQCGERGREAGVHTRQAAPLRDLPVRKEVVAVDPLTELRVADPVQRVVGGPHGLGHERDLELDRAVGTELQQHGLLLGHADGKQSALQRPSLRVQRRLVVGVHESAAAAPLVEGAHAPVGPERGCHAQRAGVGGVLAGDAEQEEQGDSYSDGRRAAAVTRVDAGGPLGLGDGELLPPYHCAAGKATPKVVRVDPVAAGQRPARRLEELAKPVHHRSLLPAL
eukprot:2769776-Prymnesium_polylepis.1